MSIGMERFGSIGGFATYKPCHQAEKRPMMFHLQCRYCAFEPEGTVTPPTVLPEVPRPSVGSLPPTGEPLGELGPRVTARPTGARTFNPPRP